MDIQLYAYWQYALGALVVASTFATWRLWDHLLRNLLMLIVGVSLVACIFVTMKRIDVGPLERILGQPAENFGFDLAPGGFPRQLYNFRGSTLVITFFSSNCVSCRIELIGYNIVAKKYKDKNAKFLTLTKEPPSYVNGFIARNPMETTFGNLTKDRRYPTYIENVGERPVLIVIDKNFIVREVRLDSLGYKKLDEIVAPYL
ncbi:MAG: peroxiredoxin family protein [Bryobacteraceae bacterium]|nr:peroxiredoxin family protein [Bryobacteraceae bacterium]